MGRNVRTLSDGHLDAGEHSMAWDGRGSNGNSVASGVYFLVVRGADYSRSSKIMVVK
jgi:flagellar hook assembly protein FlgD